MTASALLRPLRCFWFAIVLLIALPVTSHAVSIKASYGFDGAAKSGSWNPIFVTLSNMSADTVDGTLTVQQTRSPLPKSSALVNLPPHSQKRYTVYTKISEYSGPISVLLSTSSGAVTTGEAKMSIAPEDDRLIVTVGDRASSPSFLSKEIIRVPPRRFNYGSPKLVEANINVGCIEPRDLPDRPAAYQSVDVLVLQDFDATAANPKSLQAIGMWVASGGTLVIPTGPDYRKFTSNAFYDDLLPVTIQGTADVSGLNSLSALGKKPFPAGPVTICKAALKPVIGKVIISESGLPIVAAREYGAGRVIFLAFDTKSSPFRDWNGATEFWKFIIKTSEPDPLVKPTAIINPGYPQAPPSGINELLQQDTSVKMPSLNVIMIFLLSYLIVLVPVNYFVLNRRRKLEFAWVTTPAIVIFFTLTAYAIGYTTMGGRLQFQEVSFIEGSSNSRFASELTTAGLFSPARRSYDIAANDEFSISQVVRNNTNERLPDAVISDKPAIEGFAMAMWSSRSFESVSGVDMKVPVASDLILTGNHLHGILQLRNDMRLTDCVIVCGYTVTPIRDLRKGDQANVDMTIRPASSGSPGYSYSEPDLAERLKHFAIDRVGSKNVPYLIGIRADSGRVFDVKNAWGTKRSATVYAIRLDYRIGH